MCILEYHSCNDGIVIKTSEDYITESKRISWKRLILFGRIHYTQIQHCEISKKNLRYPKKKKDFTQS